MTVATMIAVRWQNVTDFAVLTIAIYLLLRWGKQARAFRVALAIVAIKAAALLARQLDLAVTSLVLDGTDLIAIILLLIVYQSELRHALTRLDVLSWLLRQRREADESSLDAISRAAFSLAAVQCGALIVITRSDPVDELIDGGVRLGGDVSPEILEAIFRKKSPVHDGATIVADGRITRVGAILPLSGRSDIASHYGTRHRAAIGLAERCDALVVVVSEERGEVSVMQGREIVKVGSIEELLRHIRESQNAPVPHSRSRWPRILLGDIQLKAAALALAVIFWSIAFFLIGNSVRTVTASVEFSNVPENTDITRLSADTVQVQVRGSGWLLDTVSLNTLVARFDLSGRKEGNQTLSVNQSNLTLPPGLVIETVSPRTISFDLTKTAPAP